MISKIATLPKIATGVMFSMFLMLAPSRLAAQNSPPPNRKTQTLTGCVERGEAVSAYKLTTKDGVWNLSATDKAASDKLGIERQINNTVTVRGTVVEPFDTKTTAKDSSRRGILNVTRITMVSDTRAK